MNSKKLPTIIAVAVSTLLLIIPVVLFWLVASFSQSKFAFVIPIVGLLLPVLIGFITFSISNKRFLKKEIIILSSAIVGLTILFFSNLFYEEVYIPSITFKQRDVHSESYIPFTDSDFITRLNEKSKLKFTEENNLPKIDGATALIPIYCSFVEAVYPETCNVEEYLNFHTTKGAYEGLIKGENDIIFVAQPSKEQLEEAKNNGVEFNLYPIGYEAFVFVVNKKNPVSDLTVQQIKDIYSGKITNWKEVGGKNKEIKSYQRDKNSGSQTAFLKLMEGTEIILPPTHQVIDVMGGLIDTVSDYQNHSNAIGYSFRYYVENMKTNIGLKILSLNGVAPTKETVRDKTYPITNNFFAITVKGKESEETKQFLDWIVSDQGQRIIEDVGYVSLN